MHYIPFSEPHLGSAVGLLLTHKSPRLRRLGVDLLIDFIKCQASAELAGRGPGDTVPDIGAAVPSVRGC